MVSLILVTMEFGLASFDATAASAAYVHPIRTESFGPHGAEEVTGFGNNQRARELEIDQTHQRLYVLHPELWIFNGGEIPPQVPRGIYGFDISAPGVHTPLGGAFPIPIAEPTGRADLGVDGTEGNLYYVEANGGTSPTPLGTLYGFDLDGNPLGGYPMGLTHKITDIAVDPIGYRWTMQNTFNLKNGVGTEVEKVLRKFSPDGAELESIDISPLSGREIAFDLRTGDLWITGFWPGRQGIFRLTASSGYTEHDRFFPFPVPGGGGERQFAFDARHGILYALAGSTGVRAYNESGDVVETFGALPSGFSYDGIAVDEATGTVYVIDDSDVEFGFKEANEGGKIAVFPGVIVPEVTTGPPSAVGHTGATVTGRLDPAGGPDVTDCKFQLVPSAAFNQVSTVTITGATGGSFVLKAGEKSTAPIPYNASAAEVQSKLEALSSIGPRNVSVGGVAGGPFAVEFKGELSGTPIGLTASGAGLTPGGATAQSVVAHAAGPGWETGSPQTVPCTPAVSPGSPVSAPTDVEAQLSGLTSGTEYRYRLVAANSNGQALGLDETLIPQPSTVETGAANPVSRTAATLNGTIDPEGEATTYYFEYGKTRYYGKDTAPPPGEALGTTTPGNHPASAGIEGLDPGATYHYRLVAVNAKGTSYGVDRTFSADPAVAHLSTDPASEVDRVTATLHGTLDPDGLETHYYFEWGKTRRYGAESAAPPGEELADPSPGEQQVAAAATGLTPQTTYHYRLVGVNEFGTTHGEDRTFTTLPAVAGLHTEAATGIEPTAATLNGTLDPDGYETTFYFQWGKTTFYGHEKPSAPGADVGTAAAGSLPLSGALAELEPGTTYHYRLVGVNEFGTTYGEDRSFTTPQGPAIEGIQSANVTATGADLKARINPNGTEASFETTYRFEYGTSTLYGQSAPVPDGTLAPSAGGQNVSVHIGGLGEVTYHFRLIAENDWGKVVSEDQTFDFKPPTSCPNTAVRQQTGTAYLPDCRAYELVSPGRAGGALLLASGPSSPRAGNRFAFTGLVTAIPGAGEPPNGASPFPEGDLYVATRGLDGWSTRYVGIPGNEAIDQGGTPSNGIPGPAGIPADRTLSRFLTWKRLFSTGTESYAPYLWDNEGNPLGRLPSNLEEVPGAMDPVAEGGFVGAAAPSADFSHYAFSSRNLAFAPGGLESAPGSVYDDDLAAGTVTLVSKTPAGADIPQDPAAAGGSAEYIRTPAVSADGSHILMSTEGPTETTASGPQKTTHLYMTVDDSAHYEVSLGEDDVNHGVRLNGMSEDGTEVFFTTATPMSADDTDTSADLYRWSENGGAPTLTRLSVGNEGTEGNRDACNPQWSIKCGVEVVPTDTHLTTTGQTQKLQPIDSALASGGGGIYFYSPEELEGSRGAPGKRNLYLWRNGTVRFVAELGAGPEEGAQRIDVSPDGAHMAFITKTRLTAYDNAGHTEMFAYDPQARELLCVSCLPDGSPPGSDVEGSLNGTFMADDGRAFFSTADALVPRDANGIADVYEYVGGRAQLISSGTGNDAGLEGGQPIGLVGVSGDGVNVFFSTYETLVAQDENGPFYKFYDARTNGGFPFNKPPAPCAAADECHGEGSSVPGTPTIGSGASLGAGGNATVLRRHKKKHVKRHRKRHHRHARHARGRGR
jgi:hypothetical protein